MNYILAPRALKQFARLLDLEQARTGSRKGDALERKFWEAFALLGRTPGLGHRRPDLADRPYFFYLLHPYYIVYEKREAYISVLSIVHSARNLAHLLKRL